MKTTILRNYSDPKLAIVLVVLTLSGSVWARAHVSRSVLSRWQPLISLGLPIGEF